MANIQILKCDGVQLKNPTTYDIQYADLDSDNSFTSETGFLVRDMIRANQRTIAVSWDRLTLGELSSLLKRCTAKSSVTLEYLDFYSGVITTGKFYTDNRQGATRKIKTLANGLFSLSFNFIEF